MKKLSKRALSFILCFVLLLSSVASLNLHSTLAEGSEGETFINRFIDYDKYTAVKGSNTYYSETDGTLWQNVVKDESVSGGAYLAVKGNPDMGPFTSWAPHHTLVMTESGVQNSISGDADNLAFPANTTFRLTLKIRAKVYDNFYLGIRYGNSAMSSNGTSMDSFNISNLVKKNEWTELSYVFTTPSAYDGSYVRCFLTLASSYLDADKEATIYREEYDLDWIKLEQLCGGEAYNEVEESYTFGFDSMPTYAVNSGYSYDADGRKFYPVHSSNANSSVQQVSVDTADGTISALKVVAAGQTSIIPVDANGKPYMIDPNSKYEIKVTAYAQYMGQYAQSFYGGGAVSANSVTYTQYDNIWNGANNILFPGTDINVEAGITSNYALYKTDSFMYTETGGNYYVSEADAKAGTSKKRVRYYTDTTKMPKYSGTLSFTTLDYTEDSMTVTGKNVTAKTPANTITLTGTHRSDESVTKELTYGTYFSIQLGGGAATPWISNGDGTATKAGGTMQQTVYIDSITITKKSQTASVSFDANGGSFSDGSTALAAETQYVGTALAPSLEVSTTAKNTFLAGWSLTPDGSRGVYTNAIPEMHNQTAYAIWFSDPHHGGYNPVNRYIDFSKYSVSGSNSYYDDSVDRTPDANNPYFYSVIQDETATGGHYLRFDMYSSESNWEANWNLTMSETGSAADMVFPENTEIHVKMRMRIHDFGKTPSLYVLYGAGNATGAYGSNVKNKTTLTPSPAFTKHPNDWVEYTFSFKTPEEYVTDSGKTYNRCFIGIMTSNSTVKYDIDTISIEQRTATNLYVKGSGGYELFDTLYGIPGTDLELVNGVSKEVYASDGTAYESVTVFDGWFSDEEGTKPAIEKFGNFDTDIYCPSTIVTLNKWNAQVGFVGFDEYFELTDGMSIDKEYALITDQDAYTGLSSLKISLPKNYSSANELKNNLSFDIKQGKTYKVDFMYKSDKDFTADIKTAETGSATNTEKLFGGNALKLSASENWTAASITVSAAQLENAIRGTSLSLVVTADDDATVYIDTLVISSVTDALGAFVSDDGLRFMMQYSCGGDNVIDLAKGSYTVAEHGLLLRGEDNTAEMTLENVGNSGIVKVTQTDLSKNFSYNPVSGVTVYSALVEGLSESDAYELTARGYLRFTNGVVYYSDYLTASSASAEKEYEFTVPDKAIDTGVSASGNPYETFAKTYSAANEYYAYFPAGTTFYSDKTYKVERWNSPANTSWVSPNFSGTGEYVLPTNAYCELTVWDGTLNGDLTVTVPADGWDRARFGTAAELKASAERTIEYVGDSAVNYMFMSDIHVGAFLRKDADGLWTVYEDKEKVDARTATRQAKITEMVNYANTHDEIDFIVIGGDIVNGYETPLNPIYQEALANGEVKNIREFVIGQIQEVLTPLKKSEKPVFVMPGNHDYNNGQSQFYTDYYKSLGTSGAASVIADLVSPRDWYNGVMKEFINVPVVQDPDYLDTNGDKLSTYYYYDFVKNGEKKRAIFLSDMDVRSTMNEDGEVIEYGTGRMTYTPEQLRWLAEVLETAEGDIAMFCHQGIDAATKGPNMDVLKNLLGAFQNKTSYKNESYGIDVDFSNGPSGHIVSYHAGHDHLDMTYYTPGANIWQMLSTTAEVYDIVSATDKLIIKNNSKYEDYNAKLIYPDLP